MEKHEIEPIPPTPATSRSAVRQGNVPDLHGERKRVTVMFVDIVGFTGIAEAVDPEHVRTLVNACFERLVPVVAKYEGTVDKFIGDAIMVLFGAPHAHENDPERALRCALEMQEALSAFDAAHGIPLSIHSGINTGLVIAGGIGTAHRQDYSVIGDAVNVASRLQDMAQQGEILVGADTYRLTSHLFDFQAAGVLRLKGKSEAVPIYKLLRARAQAAAPDATQGPGISSPLVGRAAELAVLVARLEQLQGGQGGLVSIVAEAGLGKSRLVAELRPHAATKHLTWLEGRSLSFGQDISYWPFMEIIQSDLGITAEDDEERRWVKLERRLNGLFPTEAAEFLPYLATLLAVDVPDALAERVKYLDGEAMGRQVFRSVRRFFAQLADGRPLVLVFEDCHWIDQSSMLLLEHLMPLVHERPILILGVGRPDPTAPAARLLSVAAQDYAGCYTNIWLRSLSPADGGQLVENLLENSDLSPRLREGILRKAEGNPFFIEEVVRALIDFGGLVRDKTTGRWQVTERMEQITIPDTLQAVIVARLDRLEEDVKQVIKLAAVIGRSFLYRVLQGIAEAGLALDRELDELQRLQIVREKSQHPELEYIFKHALVQAVAYESILLQRRRALHSQVGECVERLFADRLDEFYGLLAYHFTMAEDWARAQHYLFKAGDQAGMLAADAEALAHYQQALEAYTRAFGDKLDSLQLAVLERKIGEALFRRGHHEKAREHLNRALVALRSPYPATTWGVRTAIGRQLVRRIARGLLPRFLRQAPDEADLCAVERCRIYWGLVWIDYFNEPGRLLLDALLMWDTAAASGLDVDVVYSSMTVAVICDAIPLSRLAGYLHSRAVALAEQTQQPAALGLSCMGLALHEHYILGKWDGALEHYHRAASALWEAGDLRKWAATSAMLAVLLGQRGDITASLDLCKEIARVGEDAADQPAWVWGVATTAFALDQAGAIDQAVATVQPAAVLLKDFADYRSAVAAKGNLARCYLRQGKLPEAMAVLEECRHLIAEHRLRGLLCAAPWVTLAQALLMAAERSGKDERAAALGRARRACRTALRQCRFDRANLVVAYRLQGSYDWLNGKPRSAQRWWQRGLKLAEALEARYELGMTHLEIGNRTGDRGHLERAEKIFAEIGAQLDLSQARELMPLRAAHAAEAKA